MTQSMITKKLSAIVQISELDQMLAEMNQTIEQRDSKIERLKQMISEKTVHHWVSRFFILKNSQDELRDLCQKIDLQRVKVNDLFGTCTQYKSYFQRFVFLETEVNEQAKKIQELSNAFFIQAETKRVAAETTTECLGSKKS